jgi:hypothetical protein
VATPSKARVCGCSLAEISGSNPAGCMDVSLVHVTIIIIMINAFSFQAFYTPYNLNVFLASEG